MADTLIQKHELAGLDNRERGFNRMVEVHRDGAVCRAVFRYEQALVKSEEAGSAEEALNLLIVALHRQGYSQMKTRLSFQGHAYLGTQEPWVDYADPQPLPKLRALWNTLGQFLRPSRT